MLVTVEDVSVGLKITADKRLDAPVMIPTEALEAVEGAGDDLVQVETQSGSLTLHWSERGLPRSQSFTVPVAVEPQQRLGVPKSMSSVPERFLSALHEAGRSTAREPQRFALHRVQIRGAAGEVIGTDAHFAVRFEGFTLPFTEDILVPALSLFGLEELVKAGEIRLGRTAKCLVIVADDVTVWLRFDREGRYPEIASVFPKEANSTTVSLDAAEALFLLDALPELPSQDEQHRPVTLDLKNSRGVVVRAADQNAKKVVEVHLPRSTVQSGSKRLALDRRYLIRVLALGCRTLRVVSDQKPMVAAGDSVTALVMPVDSNLIVAPGAAARVLTPDSPTEPITPRRMTMKIAEPSTNGHAEGESLDPLVEAEALRNALSETLQRLSRLVTALRSRKKEQKAIGQIWSSLKNLQLGG